MSKVRLGVIDGDRVVKDAVHVPVLLVTADTTLKAGERVVVVQGVTQWFAQRPLEGEKTFSVVDPWVKRDVQRGETVYALIEPGKLHDLWHDWYMPQIDGKRER